MEVDSKTLAETENPTNISDMGETEESANSLETTSAEPGEDSVEQTAEANRQILEGTEDSAIAPIAVLQPADPEEQMDVSEEQTAQITDDKEVENVVENIRSTERNEQPTAAKQASEFSLGVPGLNFSPNNVKTANDGTKMVQIHQSQITPEQLLALQNNPNIKVVFRHVPSGRSYTKPPRHLLPPGYVEPIRKRKAAYSEKELESDDVYSFDEGIDTGVPTKMMKTNDNRARYNYGGTMKKKSGRPRILPESSAYTSTYLKPLKQSNFPAKVILTDLLSRINNPNAKREVKLHTSQINAEVLANMDLNPMYKIVLTTKQELPPLIIEDVTAEEKERLEKEAERVKKEDDEKAKADEELKIEQEMLADQTEEQQDEETAVINDKAEEEQKKIAEEKERKQKEAERFKRIKEEEENLVKSVMQKQTSRSGRIRKPSRYSLDIARLTKRKSVGAGGESSTDENEHELQKSATPKSTKKTPGRKSILIPDPGPEPSPQRGTRGSRKSVDLKKNNSKDSDEDIESAKKGTEAKKSEIRKKGNESGADEDEDKNEKAKQTESEKKESKKVKEDTTTDEKTDKDSNKKEQEATESEKEITSTKNVETDKTKVGSENTDIKNSGTVVSAEPDTSTDAGKTVTEERKKEEPQAMSVDESVKEKEEEEEIDNKYRLRKLLEQCSAEEIKSVMLPEAFGCINMGDFLLYKSGQMHNDSGEISFPQLYKQFETLHKAATKEASRYNTLVRRANKIGGDKRMEKIVLMPVYNMNAAESLEMSGSSIDAHICGIQKTMTTQMIAANSFFIKSKMETPKIRLRLPEATAPKTIKPKQRRPLFNNHHQQRFVTNQRQAEPDSTTPDKPSRTPHYIQKLSAKYNHSNSNGIQVRKPTYLEQLKKSGQIPSTAQNHVDDSNTTSSENNLQTIPVDSTRLITTDANTLQISSASSVLEQLQATVNAHQQSIVSTTENQTHDVSDSISLNPSTGELVASTGATTVTSATTTAQAEQYFVAEDGVPVSEASATEATTDESGKQLVPLGDGQYVELPEGYSLIQTDEGYIIGQPGSTFTQGEDGNVYVTNSDGTTSEITQEDVANGDEAVNVIDQIAEG